VHPQRLDDCRRRKAGAIDLSAKKCLQICGGRVIHSPYAICHSVSHILNEVAGEVAMSDQLTLFPKRASQPEGLKYVSEFIEPKEEASLIKHIAALPLEPFQFGQYEGKRRVAWFGFTYDYTLRQLRPADPIPDWLLPLVTNVQTFGGAATRIQQLLCTEYQAGVGIGWHKDKPHFDRIFGLSLGSSCKFRFRRSAGNKWDRYTLQAEPRSLYMLSGESRLVWEHSIPGVEAPRYSITFRTMRERTL
jgi:alkylated DNA repair dioxygenase AlkB